MQVQISDAKNKLRSADDYRGLVGSFFEQTVADVYEHYERELHRANAMDFDDLLFRAVNLLELFQEVRDRYAQRLPLDPRRRVPGHQPRPVPLARSCSRASTATSRWSATTTSASSRARWSRWRDGTTQADRGRCASGDEVLSCYGSGDFRPARVTRDPRRPRGEAVEISTRSGRRLVSTPEHVALRRLPPRHSPQLHMTYLQWRQDMGFRVGTTRTCRGPRRASVSGVALRAMQERADAAWVLVDARAEREAARRGRGRRSGTAAGHCTSRCRRSRITSTRDLRGPRGAT